jgi:putative nucleotidyltransferase with HDIG domain
MRLDVAKLLGGTARRLSHVRRYAALKVSRVENVAEHSFYVAFIAMAIAEDLRRKRVEVDVLKVIEGALCHDLDEAVGGDLPRPYIKAVPGLRERLNVIHARFVAGIGRELGFGNELGFGFGSSWRTQNQEELEGRIVALADVLEVAAYVAEEVRAGNGFFLGVLSEVIDDFDRVAEDYPPPLREYVIDAIRWLDGLREERLPGDVERIADLLEG